MSHSLAVPWDQIRWRWHRDQPRIALLEVFPAEAKTVHHAGLEVLGHHIDPLDQLIDEVATLGRTQVDRDAALASVMRVEVLREPIVAPRHLS